MWEVEAALPINFYQNSGAQTASNNTAETTASDNDESQLTSRKKQRFHLVVGREQGDESVVQFGSPESRHSWSIMNGGRNSRQPRVCE